MADTPVTSMSLNDVRKLIDEKNLGEDIADAVGKLLGLVLALSPVVGGPAALPLWAVIEPKNELIDGIKGAIRKFSRAKPKDYLERAERMAAANCLLVYVAFFDALRHEWPSILRELGLSEEEGKARLAALLDRVRAPSVNDRSVADSTIAIPHPIDADPHGDKRGFFEGLALEVDWVLRGLPAPGSYLTDGDIQRIRSVDGRKLVDRADEFYQAEYFGMAVEFQQFFVWGDLQHRAATTSQLQDATSQLQRLADDQRTWFELIGRALHSLDLGMQGLAEAIARQPRSAVAGAVAPDVEAVAEALHRTYKDVLDEQVIDEQLTVDESGQRLAFPQKIDGFIPQAYRVARHDSKDIHPERPDTWNDNKRPVHGDIGAFILRYLESPYSVQTPLLILGQPGSGKSLLTEVLAGHLAYPSYTAVRVKLRDADPDVELLTQLENQIKADTGGRFITWADFAGGLRMTPPVVILDGYDELLQATGQVYASYLDTVRQFQHQQAVQGRPVRVIVTSRLTLIDKVRVPHGTTVVKLEEFDADRRTAWCQVWNDCNADYFRQRQLRPFAVPASDKLLELARQPLLLLMLAIYDSLANELSTQPDFDQTLLYDRLLRRFIERELSKGKTGREFAALPATERQRAIDREMDRLGVAAIGMFNRQDVKIRREDLNADLRYFDLEHGTRSEGRALGEADLLLGSFFFIHESKSRLQNDSASPRDGSAAFEFLHNTFGEFLTADFILRRAAAEARTICELTRSPALAEPRAQRLQTLSEAWFGCLLHTPLHTRPVILDMLKEWSKHRLGDQGWTRADALAALDAILATQLRTVMNEMTIPAPAPQRRALAQYAPLPQRGRLAIYSLNLVLLRAYLGDDVYVLDEDALRSSAETRRPWGGLVSLWRSWFSLNSLSELAGMITATLRDGHIEVVPESRRPRISGSSPLYSLHDSSAALADNLTATSTGMFIIQLHGAEQIFFEDIRNRLVDSSPELNKVADLLALKMYAAPGDALPNDSLVHSHWPRPSCTTVDLDDVIARLTHSPRQWLSLGKVNSFEKVDIASPDYEDYREFSRYQAEQVVAARVKLRPDWLLLRRI